MVPCTLSALLNVETLKEWKDRSYGKAYFKKAFEHLLEVLDLFEVQNEADVRQLTVRQLK